MLNQKKVQFERTFRLHKFREARAIKAVCPDAIDCVRPFYEARTSKHPLCGLNVLECSWEASREDLLRIASRDRTVGDPWTCIRCSPSLPHMDRANEFSPIDFLIFKQLSLSLFLFGRMKVMFTFQSLLSYILCFNVLQTWQGLISRRSSPGEASLLLSQLFEYLLYLTWSIWLCNTCPFWIWYSCVHRKQSSNERSPKFQTRDLKFQNLCSFQ